ncbi:hypothetical protein [Thalassotalea maritima]
MKLKMRKRSVTSNARRRLTKTQQRKINGRYRLYFRAELAVKDDDQ